MSVDYSVRVKYEVETSQASSQVKALSSAFDSLGKFAGDIGSKMDALASKLFTVGAGLAAVGAAGALGAIKHGLVDVNAKIEDSTIGFATIFNMLGSAANFDQGLGMAKELIADIRHDAKVLPGEFQDFVGVAQTLAAPLTNAGKGLKEIRALTSDTAVAAAAMGIGFDQAGREMAMLLEGRAGAHNILGMRMGISTHTMVGGKEFNKASESDRYDYLVKALAKAKDSLPAFERSWAGLTSTMVDGVKQLLGRATFPLFERIKDTVAGINSWLDSPRLEAMADVLGHQLVQAYDFLIEKGEYIADHWTQIRDSATTFAHDIYGAFERIWPIVERIGGYLGEKLKDPGHFLGQLAGLRLGIGAVEHAPGIVKGASTLAEAGGGGAGGFVAMAGAATVALAALVGAIDVVTMEEKRYVDISGATTDEQMRQGADFWDFIGAYGKGMWVEIKQNWSQAWAETSDALGLLWTAVHPVVDIMGVALLGAVDGVIYAFRLLLAPITALKVAIEKITGETAGGGEGASSVSSMISGAIKRTLSAGKDPKQVGMISDDMVYVAAKAVNKLGGKGATNVTVNAPLTVLSDADPDRLAQKVATRIAGTLRNPTTSLGSPTFRHF